MARLYFLICLLCLTAFLLAGCGQGVRVQAKGQTVVGVGMGN